MYNLFYHPESVRQSLAHVVVKFTAICYNAARNIHEKYTMWGINILKKQISFFALLVVLIFSTVISQAQQGLTVTIGVDLAMRVGPSTEWNRVTVIPAGTAFTLEGRTGDLTWVRGVIPSGQQGWISAEFVPTGFDQIAALPIVDRTDPFSLAGAPSEAPAETATEPQSAPPVVASAPPVVVRVSQ